MNTRSILPLCLLLATCCMAQQDASEVRKKAEATSGVDCVHLFLQSGRISLEEADRRFAASDSKAAHLALDAAMRDMEHAVDCSLPVHRSQKSLEIELRELSRRTLAIEKSTESEERPYLKSVQVEIERQRDRLLHAMFGDAAGSSTEKKH
jgi:hypothetical protein